LAPPIVDAPPPKDTKPTDLPPPVVSDPNQPAAQTPAQQPSTPEQPVQRKKPSPAKPAQQSSNGDSGVSAIGQLSSGEPADIRQRTENSIASTEKGLKGIGRKLNDAEQKTASQIREYLRQARAALTGGDIDGATTLAEKAKVLLGELTR
jgi:outer membrane biosynthesis protein TonB